MTKFEQAYAKFLENTNVARKDFIVRLVKELGMSEAGASTYHSNCKKKFKEINSSTANLVEERVSSRGDKLRVYKVTGMFVLEVYAYGKWMGIDNCEYKHQINELFAKYGA